MTRSCALKGVGSVIYIIQGLMRGPGVLPLIPLIRSNIPFESEKVVADPAGRFVIVTGRLCSTQVILASVYAPNWDEQFISKLFNSIPNIETYHIIVGGDFNFVQDAVLDRSSSRPYSINNSAKPPLRGSWACQTHGGLGSPIKNPLIFFSHVHHSYSRIDFFLLDNTLISNIHSYKFYSDLYTTPRPVQPVHYTPLSFLEWTRSWWGV